MMTYEEVLSFWSSAGESKWWNKDDSFDEEIRTKFSDIRELAVTGRLEDWESSADGLLALIIVIDQFSRNMFRGSPEVYAYDSLALSLCRRALSEGVDAEMRSDLRSFCYMPLVHSEDLSNQEEFISRMAGIGINVAEVAPVSHRDIIAQFGRFPHRNEILGRVSTPEEEKYLAEGGFMG